MLRRHEYKSFFCIGGYSRHVIEVQFWSENLTLPSPLTSYNYIFHPFREKPLWGGQWAELKGYSHRESLKGRAEQQL